MARLEVWPRAKVDSAEACESFRLTRLHEPLLPHSPQPRRRLSFAIITCAAALCFYVASKHSEPRVVNLAVNLTSNACDTLDVPLPYKGLQTPIIHVVGGNPLAFDFNFDMTSFPSVDLPRPSYDSGRVTLCIQKPSASSMTAVQAILSLRGSSSSYLPKPQFWVTILEQDKVSLLGLPAANGKALILSAVFFDTSFIRNPLAFQLYRKAGGWAPETAFANLVFQGQPVGLYYLGQPPTASWPILNPQNPAEKYFGLSLDWIREGGISSSIDFTRQEPMWVRTNSSNTAFIIGYPFPFTKGGLVTHSAESNAVLTQQVQADMDYVAAALNRIDHAIALGLDITELVDLESMARMYITEEVAKDPDGYALSNYFALRNGQLVHASPWDFDLAFGFACRTPKADEFFVNIDTGEANVGAEGWNVSISSAQKRLVATVNKPSSL